MAREGLTVKDIAALICGREETVAQVIERLRHWTRVGLLSPDGGRRPGTGTWRRYGRDAIYRAAVLNALAQYHVTAGYLEPVMEMLTIGDDPRRDELWEKAKTDTPEVVLALFPAIGGNGNVSPLLTDSIKDAVRYLVRNPTGLWVNLTETFAPLR